MLKQIDFSKKALTLNEIFCLISNVLWSLIPDCKNITNCKPRHYLWVTLIWLIALRLKMLFFMFDNGFFVRMNCQKKSIFKNHQISLNNFVRETSGWVFAYLLMSSFKFKGKFENDYQELSVKEMCPNDAQKF